MNKLSDLTTKIVEVRKESRQFLLKRKSDFLKSKKS